jgi:anti-sigma factor RsiW
MRAGWASSDGAGEKGMSEQRAHPHDEIQDLLDGRLADSARASVDAHLETCEACRGEIAALLATRDAARAAHRATVVPSTLEGRLREALVAERRAASQSRRVVRVLAAVAAVVAVAIVGVFLVPRTHLPDLASILADDFAALREGNLRLEERTDSADLGSYFAAHGAPAAVYDLSMMGWRLAGGAVHPVRGTPTSLAVYGNDAGGRLICAMLAGTHADLPADGEVFRQNGVALHVFRRGGVTVVLWQDGQVLCALFSDAPRDEVLGIAREKSKRV